MNIIHNNIKSIQRNFDTFMIMMGEFLRNLNCLVLTELEVLEIQINIIGYDLLSAENRYNQNDGVAVLVKCPLTYT